ncbi:MAG: ribosome silencing factor [Synergistaceae bacterium]|nr:ribosome silencing factor [Synergistaceae bacterium]
MEVNKTKEEFYNQYKPIIDALLDKHALTVSIHDLSEVSGFTEAFIVAIAKSDLHAKTLKATVSDLLDELHLPHKVEGENSSKWCLMDAGHVVVNILSKDGNDYYRLDSLWEDAPVRKFIDEDEEITSV